MRCRSIIANSGGVNPPACTRAAAKILSDSGLADVKVACVTGDDLLPRLPELLAAGCAFSNLDTGEPLTSNVEISLLLRTPG